MSQSQKKGFRAQRQARVAGLVWGMVLMAGGVLFMLESRGAVDLRVPRHTADLAVDGDPGTRWSSGFSDDEWIAVDLGAPAQLTRVELVWEAAHAQAYQIQVSSDGATWTTVLEVTDADGERDVHEVAATARHVRVKGERRGTFYGYSLWELEIYGRSPDSGSEELLSRGRLATASSTEGIYFWSYMILYWPLLLAAGGLPALLAPKDGGDQVVGLAMAGIGTLLLLRNLGFTTWGFRESAPVVVALAGLLLVIQSLRKTGRSDPSSQGDAKQ